MKILFFPPPNLEVYMLYLDWLNALKEVEYTQVVGFSEGFGDLQGKTQRIREIILDQKPDAILGFDLYFMGFTIEHKILHKPIMEELKVPYFSIFTGDYFHIIHALISPIRFFPNFKGAMICEEGYVDLMRVFMHKPCIDVGYTFPELAIRPEKLKVRSSVLVKNIDRYKKDLDYDYCFISQEIEEFKKNLISFQGSFVEALNLLPEYLRRNLLSLIVMEEIHAQRQIEWYEDAVRHLEKVGLEVVSRFAISSFVDFLNLAKEFVLVVGDQNSFLGGVLDRFSWLGLRLGSIPLLPSWGGWDNSISGTLSNWDDLRDFISEFKDPYKRVEIQRSMYQHFAETSKWREKIRQAREWMEAVLNEKVPGPRVELGTPGFSGLRSTT